MVDINNLCFSCMQKSNNGICTVCGFNNNTYEVPLHHLRPGTILNGKYVIGKSIGEGGFGITYVGYELNLGIKVAIKEFFPSGVVSRDCLHTDTVTIFSGNSIDAYNKGKDSFIKEARVLAQFERLPGVVSVRDFFNENGTAYIVMEYVEGETLKEFLQRNGGRVEAELLVNMMRPLMESLIQIHNAGIIHRDISPDNIKINKNFEMTLIDFGAAREMSMDGNKSMSIQLKPGYAPEEQYRTHGKQGAWTDVYALCATMYRAITGKTPVESLERVHNDTLSLPSEMGIQISSVYESAIMNGMAVFASNRISDVSVLYDELYNKSYNTSGGMHPHEIKPKNIMGNSSGNRIGDRTGVERNQRGHKGDISSTTTLIVCLTCLAIVVIIGFMLLLSNVMRNADKRKYTSEPVATAVSTATPLPKPIFTHISASSTRDTDYTAGYANNYYVEYAIDGNMSTAWACDRNLELTPTLTLAANTKQYVSGIRISNGYCKNEQTYKRNRRITKIQVSYDGGSVTANLTEDAFGIMQDVKFAAPVYTSFISVKVLETVYGDWKDINISEIEAY